MRQNCITHEWFQTVDVEGNQATIGVRQANNTRRQWVRSWCAGEFDFNCLAKRGRRHRLASVIVVVFIYTFISTLLKCSPFSGVNIFRRFPFVIVVVVATIFTQLCVLFSSFTSFSASIKNCNEIFCRWAMLMTLSLCKITIRLQNGTLSIFMSLASTVFYKGVRMKITYFIFHRFRWNSFAICFIQSNFLLAFFFILRRCHFHRISNLFK